MRASLAWCLANGEGARACALIAAVCRWWNITGRIAELFPLARQAVTLICPPSFDKVMTYYAMLLGLDVLEVEAAAQAAADPLARRRVDELVAIGIRERDDMLALARQLGDDNGLALALYCQADIPWARGDLAEAARLYGEAAEAASRAGSGSLALAAMSDCRLGAPEGRLEQAGGDGAPQAVGVGEKAAAFGGQREHPARPAGQA